MLLYLKNRTFGSKDDTFLFWGEVVWAFGSLASFFRKGACVSLTVQIKCIHILFSHLSRRWKLLLILLPGTFSKKRIFKSIIAYGPLTFQSMAYMTSIHRLGK